MDEKESILIVDDDESTCRSLSLILSKKGYDTEAVRTGRESIEKVQGRFFNIVLVDIRLPDMEGVELIKLLKEMHPNAVVIMITAYASIETAVKALNGGASAYITKPLDMEEVLISIGDALTRQRLIREKRRTEEALKESEKKYRCLVEDSVDGIAIVQGLEIKFVNRSLMRMYGCQREKEMVGHTFTDFVSPEYRSLMAERGFARERGEHIPSHYEFKALRKDGIEFDAELSVTLIDYLGSTARQGIIRNITERKRMEKQLRESEKRYRILLESSMDAVFVIVNTRYVYANQRAAKLLGFSDPSEVVGRDSLEFVAPLERDRVRAMTLGRQKGEEHPNRYEVKLRRKDGSEIDCETHVSVIEFDGKPASLAFTRDITERKWMEEELRQYSEHLKELVEERTTTLQEAQERLLESERMAAAGRVAAMVGHDLRSPLQVIKSSIKRLKKRPEKREEMLMIIDDAVDRATQMLEEIRYRTEESPLRIEDTDLVALIQRTVEEAAVPDYIEVIVSMGDSLNAVPLDPATIQRVLDNLRRNSVEAMPQGGILTIDAEKTGDKVTIKICDTGVGIPDECKPNLFKPFYSTKHRGVGLGLAYCKRTVESHGGTITFESNAGEGAIFTVTLPAMRP